MAHDRTIYMFDWKARPAKKSDGPKETAKHERPVPPARGASYPRLIFGTSRAPESAVELETAAKGTAGAGKALPHIDQIQASFGRHELGHVSSHMGRDATGACENLGAKAYTVGDQVAFRSAPDLHLAAHEAAHVLQQRAGVVPAGEASDEHERHADAVADRVVRRESAEGLLDRYRGAASSRAVQLAPEDEADAPGRKGVKDRGLVITFLMGSGDAFYTEAKGYWDQTGKADVLVADKTMLGEVIDYLHANPPSNGKPWAEINIVVHASEDGGMMIKYDADSKENVTQSELQGKVDKGKVKALPDTIVDSKTNVNVHGCALGRNAAMLKTLSAAVGGTDKEAPAVYAPKNLQGYAHSGSTHEEFHAEYWTVGYPKDNPITGKKLVDEFKKQHPGVVIDWDKEVPNGVKRKTTYDAGADISYFKMPKDSSDHPGHARLLAAVSIGSDWKSWTVADHTSSVVGAEEIFKLKYDFVMNDGTRGSKPIEIKNPWVPRTKKDQEAYVKAELGANYDRYSWKITLTDGKGNVGDQIDAKLDYLGTREFVRVQRDLLDAQSHRIDPSRTDTTHYGSFTPAPPAKPATP